MSKTLASIKWNYRSWSRKNSIKNLLESNQWSSNSNPMLIRMSWSDLAALNKSNSKPTAIQQTFSWRFWKARPCKHIDLFLSTSMSIQYSVHILLSPWKIWTSAPFNSMSPKLELSKLRTKDCLNSTTQYLITIMKTSENNCFKISKKKETRDLKRLITFQQPSMLTQRREQGKKTLNR